MIASLRGVLVEKGAGHCVIEAGGVGYLVQISVHTHRALPDVGSSIFLYAHQVVREDAHLLFGFADLDERRLFELLTTVSGVGPRVAIALLSGLRPAALVRALREENVAALVAVPGIGRKTAERLIVELRDRLEAPVADAGAGAGVLPKAERFEDAIAALVQLGYTRPQAQEAVRRSAEAESELPLELIVRRALARLGKTAATTR
jgi:Holliday junction DNA helicase RuvA